MFTRSKISNEIVVLNDGDAAIKYLFNDKGDCKLIENDLPLVMVLDLNLPKVHGIDILRKIRSCESTKLIPVIVLSGSREEDTLITSYLLGVIAFVRKPVKFNDFIEAIRELGLYILITQKQPLEFLSK
jgi:DNA-binding response OmpR family regulator